MKKIHLLYILYLLSPVVWAQETEWKLINKLSIKDVDQVSFDNRGQIFYTTADGSLYQLSPNGVPINHFSPSRQARISQLEAAWTVNIFTFSKDLQRFELFDRFLNTIMSRDLNDFEIGLARAATMGNNNSIWVFDESNMSLKRIDYRRQTILQRQPLNLVLEDQEWDVLDIKEAQNILFLRVPDRVILFDNQGNFLKRLSMPGESPLAIWRENIYNIEEGEILEYKWNTGMKTALELPSVIKDHNHQVHADHIVFYDKGSILIYRNPFSPKR